MDTKATVGRIYDHLEADALEKAVMACLRLSRHLQDHLNAMIFLRELYPSKEEVSRVLYDDTIHLDTEAQKFVWEKSFDRWIEIHDVKELGAEYSHLPEGDRPTLLNVSVGEVEPEIAQWNNEMAYLKPPNGMSAYDTAAFAETYDKRRQACLLRLKALQSIKSRLKTRCLNYAIQIERQLDMQDGTESFLWTAQNEVHNYFKSHSDDVFKKLQKANQLSRSSDTEDASLLLTEIRRTIKSVADYLYPPANKLVTGKDGKQRKLGQDQYLNRMEQAINELAPQTTTVELLGAEFELLSVFVRRLNDVASKGVHSSVSIEEAKQGLVSLYMFLFNSIQHLSNSKQAATTSTDS